MSFHDINFTASVSDLFDQNGNKVPDSIARGVYRDDTGELISIAGKNTKLVQHMDVLSPVLDHFDAQGYTIEERAPGNTHALYDLRGKKGLWVNTSVAASGAVARVDLISGDFVEPKTSWASNGEDTMFHRISLLNSHDGSLAVHANASYLRLVCLNGMVDERWSVNTRAKHTLGLDVESMKARIAKSVSLMGEDAERFTQYARTKVSPEQAAVYFQRTIAKLAPKSDGTPHWSEPLVQQLLANFKLEDQTVWGVWNAMTAWSTHGERRSGSVALTTTLGREQRVAQAMRQPEWNALLAA